MLFRSDDGELEYVPPKMLCGQATKIIRQYRPDAVLSVDPGEWYERWHKSDHRMAAFNTADMATLVEIMRQDKKAQGGKLTFILARDIGDTFIAKDVNEHDVLNFLTEDLRQR